MQNYSVLMSVWASFLLIPVGFIMAVTDCKLEGAQETESIGGAALEELSKQVVAANGPAIDGVAGATVTTKAVRKAVAAALGVELAEEAPADSAAAAPAEPAAIVPVEGGIQIGQAYAAAHGTKCFTEAVAVVKDDVILAAYLDDFQFTSTDAGVTAVPNSDSDFAAGYAEGKVLMSKRANADYYSKMMAEKGGSSFMKNALTLPENEFPAWVKVGAMSTPSSFSTRLISCRAFSGCGTMCSALDTITTSKDLSA